jgi:hypothetical protein
LKNAIIHRMKIVIVIAFVGILLSLGAAGLFMLRGNDEGDKKNNDMARALSLRIGLSVAIFVLLLIMWSLGLIEPNGIIPAKVE